MHAEMNENALAASNFLKAISHEGRLKILCYLLTGEKSVSDIQDALSLKQASTSQQLSRLRLEGLISDRRDGKSVYYKISDAKVHGILSVVYELFCADEANDKHHSIYSG